MSVVIPLTKDHDALGSEFCSGYRDTLGRWMPGFYCPGDGDSGSGSAGGAVRSAAVFCCGSASYKYCCTQRERDAGEGQAGIPLLLLGAALGAAAAIALLVVASCCCCSCCALYKKRHAAAASMSSGASSTPLPPPGTLYRTQAPSAASGVANMYSASAHNSLTTTPVDSTTSRLLVELDAAPGGAAAGAGLQRGNTFGRQPAGAQQRNGRAASSPHLDQSAGVPPPYDGRGPRHPGSHHTLPHQRHHQSGRQSTPASTPQCPQTQRSASQHHFTLPRPHQQPLQTARSPVSTFAPTSTATLSRVPRGAPVSVPVPVPQPPQPPQAPPNAAQGQHPGYWQSGVPPSSPPPQNVAVRLPVTAVSTICGSHTLSRSTSSTFAPAPVVAPVSSAQPAEMQGRPQGAPLPQGAPGAAQCPAQGHPQNVAQVPRPVSQGALGSLGAPPNGLPPPVTDNLYRSTKF